MPLEFDIKNITVTEFGVGREGKDDLIFVTVTVNAAVQDALVEMASETWEAMQRDDEGGRFAPVNLDSPAEYQPSEKHGGTEYLYLPRGHDLERTVRKLHDAQNLPIDAAALNEPDEIVCYFARFVDDRHRHLTALRRAGHFKGVLKKRLVWVFDDSLRIVEDRIFKLDSDFDLLVDSERTHIWRPSSFESVSGLKQAILEAVQKNVDKIRQQIPFVDFESIQQYASDHSRAARSLASLQTQDLAGIKCKALVGLCKNTGVQVEEVGGRGRVPTPQVMGFLEVLDRRRYQLELVPGIRERFRAISRRQIQGT